MGIDLGLRTLATLSNGLMITNLDLAYEEKKNDNENANANYQEKNTTAKDTKKYRKPIGNG